MATTLMTSLVKGVRKSGKNPTLPSSQYGSWPWASNRNRPGIRVNDESALSLGIFYRGVGMIAADVAAAPFHVLQGNLDGTSTPAQDAANYYLWGRPNLEMTRQSMWERVIGDEVRGNGFIWVEKDDIGQPLALWYLDRRRVRVGRAPDLQKVYLVDNEMPMIDYKQGGEILHFPNWGGSLVGYDIVKIAAEAIALGLSAEQYAVEAFSEGTIPPGLLTTDQELTPEQSKQASDEWNAKKGARNWHKARVLSRGVKYQVISADMEKMQMMALRDFQKGEIATLLGIPPVMLGLVDKTTSWGTGVAEQELGYTKRTLRPHTTRFEQGINDDLLVRQLTNRYVKMDMDGQLRGTTLQRYQAYALGYGRWLSTNDIRRDEDLPPVDGGDDVLAAVNMVPIDQLGLVAPTAPSGPPA